MDPLTGQVVILIVIVAAIVLVSIAALQANVAAGELAAPSRPPVAHRGHRDSPCPHCRELEELRRENEVLRRTLAAGRPRATITQAQRNGGSFRLARRPA